MGSEVSKWYYKINGATSYTSTTGNQKLAVDKNFVYYYYGVPTSGSTLYCTESKPCSGTMPERDVNRTLY